MTPTPGVRRIVVLANRLPFPLDDGWNVRTFHGLRAMARLADTTLLVFEPDDASLVEAARAALGVPLRVRTVPRPRLHTLRRAALGAITSSPVHVWTQESAAFHRAFREELERAPVDVVLTEATFFERYLREAPSTALKVVDTHNIDSLQMRRNAQHDRVALRRWYAGMTVPKLEALENRVYAAADLTWVCSDDEVRAIARRVPDAHVVCAPNGVDTDALAPDPTHAPVADRLVFFGRLDYFPNVDAMTYMVEEILPRILRLRPQATLRVIGSGDRSAVDRIVAGHPAVEVIGRVPDVRPEVGQAAVVVVPLRSGGGTRLKILEAMSMARPVVSTSIGAEGIEIVHGRDALLVDDADAFASAAARLLADPAEGERIGAAGRRLVIDRYDWKSLGERLAADVLALAADRASSPAPAVRVAARNPSPAL
jgi:glycosyltransferase involved in cell wall biosynthesis